jgi:DUF4097 and DUF4098 domain-containing protein YvlB
MPTYDTPGPIAVTVELLVGDVRITASDRTDTVVDVRPSRAKKASDARAAREVRVELVHGELRIKSPKQWRQYSPFGPNGSADVTIEVPTGSSVNGSTGMGSLRVDGEVGSCRFRSGMGDLRLDHTGELHLKTGFGSVVVDRAEGDADVHAAGDIRIGEVAGTLTVKNANGDTVVGRATSDVEVKAANGAISIGQAGGSVRAKSAVGNIRVGEVGHGVVVLRTSMGDLDIGIPEGAAAYLEANTQYGRVRNTLTVSEGPGGARTTVEVRAQTSYGDVHIHRAVDQTGPERPAPRRSGDARTA